ncbi:MAG: hypothetical protein KA713_16965 [Chryseotalea sp. WA131a]|jgi:hypothetical protein|nr:MAG: hypothetical protein KA713_16965 [Chryseotalea sp. WA131a]
MKNHSLIKLLAVILIVVVSCNKEEVRQKPRLKIDTGLLKYFGNGRTDAVIVQPNGGTYYTGNTMAITWGLVTCTGCGDWSSQFINIDLYGGGVGFRIASNVPFIDSNFQSQYNWAIQTTVPAGSNYKIRISNSANSSQFSDSNNFSLVTPNTGCFYSHWTLTGAPSFIYGKTTVNYSINASAQLLRTYANRPIMKVFSYDPITINYNGTSYYCPGAAGVNIPINSSFNCSGSGSSISAPLTFSKTGSSTTIIITLNAVSKGHSFSNGYHSFSFF